MSGSPESTFIEGHFKTLTCITGFNRNNIILLNVVF